MYTSSHFWDEKTALESLGNLFKVAKQVSSRARASTWVLLHFPIQFITFVTLDRLLPSRSLDSSYAGIGVGGDLKCLPVLAAWAQSPVVLCRLELVLQAWACQAAASAGVIGDPRTLQARPGKPRRDLRLGPWKLVCRLPAPSLHVKEGYRWTVQRQRAEATSHFSFARMICSFLF